MRPSFYARSSGIKAVFNVPPELYPLYAACFVVCCSATYFSAKKLIGDKSVRLTRKIPTYDDKLEEALEKKE